MKKLDCHGLFSSWHIVWVQRLLIRLIGWLTNWRKRQYKSINESSGCSLVRIIQRSCIDVKIPSGLLNITLFFARLKSFFIVCCIDYSIRFVGTGLQEHLHAKKDLETQIEKYAEDWRVEFRVLMIDTLSCCVLRKRSWDKVDKERTSRVFHCSYRRQIVEQQADLDRLRDLLKDTENDMQKYQNQYQDSMDLIEKLTSNNVDLKIKLTEFSSQVCTLCLCRERQTRIANIQYWYFII